MSIDNPFAGYGGKRPLLYIPYKQLFLDPQNPRLPAEVQGKDEQKLSDALKRYFNLEEIAMSMATNGYFDEEPIVGIPKLLPSNFEAKTYEELKIDKDYFDFINDSATEFYILEGNRRLSTVKLLMQGNVAGFPPLEEQVRKDLEKLPVIIYPKRKDVIAYLGARHIIGVSKWDAYAKARYVASMKEDYGLSLDEIQKTVGDTSNSARKTYISYKLIETVKAENEDYDTSKAKENFSYIMLAFGQSAIKEYVGLAKQWTAVDVDNPIQPNRMRNLFNVFSWLFGEGKEKSKVIEESRDITAKLSPVLRNATATQYLIEHRDLKEAYERCDGEADLLIRYIKRASRDLGKALPLATNPTYINSEVKAAMESCERIFVSLKQLTI